jgi:hypothetical protein
MRAEIDPAFVDFPRATAGAKRYFRSPPPLGAVPFFQ